MVPSHGDTKLSKLVNICPTGVPKKTLNTALVFISLMPFAFTQCQCYNAFLTLNIDKHGCCQEKSRCMIVA